MAGRGPQTFKKRQKEQARKEKQQEKLARRLNRKNEPAASETEQTDIEPIDPDQEVPATPEGGETHVA